MKDRWLSDLVKEIRMIRRMKKGHSFKRRHGDTRRHTVHRCFRNTKCGGK